MREYILIIQSLRPKQWTKNLFIFAGLLFSKNIFNKPLLFKAVSVFFIFCLLTGCMYILNDILDLERDRKHTKKTKRPIASGSLRVSKAAVTIIVLTPILLGLSYLLGKVLFLVSLSYVVLQVCYSLLLKDIVILDVFSIALGFVLRVMAGAVSVNVRMSSWLIICTILLSLFLALSKRRHELALLESEAHTHRKVLGEYSPHLLDQMSSVVTASTVIAYCLYTVAEETIARFGTRNLLLTVPFVLYGILRYLYLVHQANSGGSPEQTLLSDKPLLIDIFLWALAVFLIIYF